MPVVYAHQDDILDFYYYQNEVWKDLPEYETIYQISDFGRIKSVDKYVHTEIKNQEWRFVKGKLMKIGLMWQGYSTVTLNKDGVSKHHRLHRLVALAFIDNPDNKPDVNHKNGIKHDCRAVNLEWCTKSENMLHSIRTGLQGAIGEENHLAKLTEQQVIAMRKDLAGGMSIPQIIAKYNTPEHATRNAMKNKSWKYLLK